VKAAIYARYSTDKQRDASIEDQVRECERVARAGGFTVVARFEDKGVSGGTAQRPGYQSMLTGARRHEFCVILVEDISRLWRNRAEFGPRSAELEDLGVHMVTAVGDDTRRDGWGLVVQIKQAVAEHARREASYRTRRGLEGVALSGKSAGGRAYGYIPAAQSTSGDIEVEPREAAIVLRIFEEYAAGHSPRNIAARLNQENVPSPGAAWRRKDTGSSSKRRGKWVASAIAGDRARGYGILNNERYVGKTTWGRLQWKRGAADSMKRTAIVVADRDRWVTHEDPRLRIVSDELWERVKARQAHQAPASLGASRSRAGRPAGTLLSGLLLCGNCGSRFVASDQRSYQCATRTYGGLSGCSNSLRVNRERAERRIAEYLSDELLSPAAIELASSAYQDEIKRGLKDAVAEAAPDAKLEQIAAEEAQLRAMLKAGRLSADILKAALEALEQKRRRVLTLRERPRAAPARIIPLVAERYRAAVRNIAKHLGRSDQAPEARTLVRELLGGQGTVFVEGGKIGARFAMAGLIELATEKISNEINDYKNGSGGRI
jgi:site-specific DNA recombinase